MNAKASDASARRSPSRSPATTVFLDRDGVINRRPPTGEYVTRWSEFEFLPDVPEAIARMTKAGLRIFVVTNQRGIARGLVERAEVERIHRRMTQALARSGGRIDAVYCCPHNDGECDCRKPGVGLFRNAERDHPDIDFKRSVLIGDSWTDIQAGNAIGALTILIAADPKTAHGAAKEAAGLGLRVDAVVGSLAEAADLVLAHRGQ
ncbi:MAG: HAD family hydrolase [Candidatus Bipolaricaulis sp.]|nr:HAD family hydrolase [Candidatus Bipolaricaulis sp.]